MRQAKVAVTWEERIGRAVRGIDEYWEENGWPTAPTHGPGQRALLDLILRAAFPENAPHAPTTAPTPARNITDRDMENFTREQYEAAILAADLEYEDARRFALSINSQIAADAMIAQAREVLLARVALADHRRKVSLVVPR